MNEESHQFGRYNPTMFLRPAVNSFTENVIDMR
jgi:hypothetical protein